MNFREKLSLLYFILIASMFASSTFFVERFVLTVLLLVSATFFLFENEE